MHPQNTQDQALPDAHAIRGVRDGLWHCECGAMWAVNVFDPPADVVAFTQHQADMLAAAGPLVTPEHEATR